MVVAKVDQCLVIEQVAAEAISHPKALHNHNVMKKKKRTLTRFVPFRKQKHIHSS